MNKRQHSSDSSVDSPESKPPVAKMASSGSSVSSVGNSAVKPSPHENIHSDTGINKLTVMMQNFMSEYKKDVIRLDNNIKSLQSTVCTKENLKETRDDLLLELGGVRSTVEQLSLEVDQLKETYNSRIA